jgi:hypothetical protein
MTMTNHFFRDGKGAVMAGSALLLAALAMSLTGCGGYVDGPGATVAVASPAIVAQDDYVYYPSYGIYYSGSRHQYAYLEGGAWVSQPAPRGVAIETLRASPSVKMDFHDAPANHHAAVARQYPKNWKPAPSNQHGDNREEHGGK